MYKQKFKEREKAFTQQQKELKSLKAHGKSKAHAVSCRGGGRRGGGGRGEGERIKWRDIYYCVSL